MTPSPWQEQKQLLLQQLQEKMNFLVGSVVAYRHKCGPRCHCNQGQGHIGFYLSVNQEGKTRNLYLHKNAVEEARSRVAAYGEVKRLLKQISRINYRLLQESFPTRRRSPAKPPPPTPPPPSS